MVEENQKQHYQSYDDQDASSEELVDSESMQGELVPGVPIVRSNTPRPLSFDSLISADGIFSQTQQSGPIARFPSKAPSAPPLPEEPLEAEAAMPAPTPLPQSPSIQSKARVKSAESAQEQEFVWLFEYGLEMDPMVINSQERLGGMALLYGPAVLKGYRLVLLQCPAGDSPSRGGGQMAVQPDASKYTLENPAARMGPAGTATVHTGMGTIIAAIVPGEEAGAEVWGLLYRVPHRVIEHIGSGPSLLDKVHIIPAAQPLLRGGHVVVHETYRDRDLTCVTYIATQAASQLLRSPAPGDESAFLRRLVAIGRKQRLPDTYLGRLLTKDNASNRAVSQAQAASEHQNEEVSSVSSVPLIQPSLPVTGPGMAPAVHLSHTEQNTDPLPVVRERLLPALVDTPAQLLTQLHRRLIIFAIYLFCLLLIVLIFAILQGLGFGNGVLNASLTLLGVPWMVIVYGLLGGCISCIVTLGRLRVHDAPLFVLITWFARPYIGAVLAIAAYLLLTSGLFAFGADPSHHLSAFWLAGVVAGFCEGWIFFRRRF